MEATLLRGKANYVIRDYVLPDYIEVKRGYVRAPEETTGKSQAGEQIIRMNNERIAVPEILFHPSDVGVQVAMNEWINNKRIAVPEILFHPSDVGVQVEMNEWMNE